MYQTYVKRGLDIVVAATSLTLLFVPLGAIALWITLETRGSFLFSHKRAGKNLVPFTTYKLRTMAVSAPAYEPTNDFKDASAYITRSGKILRKLSIDELPQLVNVLKGEMSIVGPRPVMVNETELLVAREKYNANSCKPGITGWAQVNGRDELRVDEKARMDGEYIENFGPMMDLRCVVMTVWAVLSVSGHKEGHELSEPRPTTARYSAKESN
jgi:O-antigen biosynthesis protein WbqP